MSSELHISKRGEVCKQNIHIFSSLICFIDLSSIICSSGKLNFPRSLTVVPHLRALVQCVSVSWWSIQNKCTQTFVVQRSTISMIWIFWYRVDYVILMNVCIVCRSRKILIDQGNGRDRPWDEYSPIKLSNKKKILLILPFTITPAPCRTRGLTHGWWYYFTVGFSLFWGTYLGMLWSLLYRVEWDFFRIVRVGNISWCIHSVRNVAIWVNQRLGVLIIEYIRNIGGFSV